MHSDHRHQADLEHSDFSLPREGGGCTLQSSQPPEGNPPQCLQKW